MHRADLAGKPGAELRKHPLDLQQRAKKTVGVLCIVMVMIVIFVERNGISDFAGYFVDLAGQTELPEILEHGVIEARHAFVG